MFLVQQQFQGDQMCGKKTVTRWSGPLLGSSSPCFRYITPALPLLILENKQKSLQAEKRQDRRGGKHSPGVLKDKQLKCQTTLLCCPSLFWQNLQKIKPVGQARSASCPILKVGTEARLTNPGMPWLQQLLQRWAQGLCWANQSPLRDFC